MVGPVTPGRMRRSLLAAVVVASLSLAGCAAGHRAAATPHSTTAVPTAPATVPALYAGPDGPEAAWVVSENRRPGTSGWQITGAQQPHGIEGYADAVQAQVGARVTLYVSTSAPTFTADAYRMGYYQGQGGRSVWQSPATAGRRQPACPVTPHINMVQCRWAASLSFTVTRDWVQGEYLIKLVGSGGQQSYVPLTITDPTSTAAYVIMDGSLTDEVFNAYGGYSLYQGATPCAPNVYPCSSRSRVVSFDRPYTGSGDGGYLALTYPLTRLAEQHGLDVTYWTGLTLAEHGDQLLQHRVLLSPAHDEEWSASMRTATTAAIARGVNVAFFGASPVLRKIRLQASPLGLDRQIVNYRDPQQDPDFGVDNAAVSQNSWDQAPADEPSSELAGATYIGYNNEESFPLVVTEPGSWLYAGTGLALDAKVPGVLRADFQEFEPGESGPTNVEIQAHSPVQVQMHGAEHADTSYYTTPSGAGVWQSGTNEWIPAIGRCTTGQPCSSALLQTMTLNVLRALGSGPLADRYPSRANWRQYYP